MRFPPLNTEAQRTQRDTEKEGNYSIDNPLCFSVSSVPLFSKVGDSH
jgi:hypothetical protein